MRHCKIISVFWSKFFLLLACLRLWTLNFSKKFLITVSLSRLRCLSTKAQAKVADSKAHPAPKALAHNQSFVHNLFRGQVEHSQVFPFPIALDQEQIEYVAAFVDPVTKFFEEVNDAARNDLNAVSLNVHYQK